MNTPLPKERRGKNGETERCCTSRTRFFLLLLWRGWSSLAWCTSEGSFGACGRAPRARGLKASKRVSERGKESVFEKLFSQSLLLLSLSLLLLLFRNDRRIFTFSLKKKKNWKKNDQSRKPPSAIKNRCLFKKKRSDAIAFSSSSSFFDREASQVLIPY